MLGVILLCVLGSGVGAQGQAVKVDEFRDLNTDDTLAHLDIFAKRLTEQPKATGTIVAHYSPDWLPGFFLRDTHGYLDYLVNRRGISENRLSVTAVESKNSFRTELWLVPEGAQAPVTSSPNLFVFTDITQFDDLYFGPGCESEFTITLEDPTVAVRLFATVLQRNPTMKGVLIVHPINSPTNQQSQRIFASSVQSLVNDYKFPPERMISSMESARSCGQIQFWLVPPDFKVPTQPKVGTYLQTLLMDEAENGYSVRRVEFFGNKHTRDNVLRVEMPGLNEGEIFKKAVLIKSLNDVSRLKVIYPIGIDDVEVNLNRAEQTIDLTLFFRERRRTRR